MNMRKLINLIESFENSSSLTNLFDINGEIVQTFLRNFFSILEKGEFTPNEFNRLIFISICKMIWEDLYQLIEENILADDGYSINVEPELSMGEHYEGVDCYGQLTVIGNGTPLWFRIWFNTDTDVQGDSFEHQLVQLIVNFQHDEFRLNAVRKESDIPSWDHIFINILHRETSEYIHSAPWGKYLFERILKSIDSSLKMIGVPVVVTNSLGGIQMLIKNNPDVLQKLNKFFNQYGILVESLSSNALVFRKQQ